MTDAVLECTDCGALALGSDEETELDCTNCGPTTHEPAHYSTSDGTRGVGTDTVREVATLVLGDGHVDRIRKNHTRVVEVEFDREVADADLDRLREAFEGMNLEVVNPEDGRFAEGVNPYCFRVIRKHWLSEQD